MSRPAAGFNPLMLLSGRLKPTASLHYSHGSRNTIPGTAGILAGRDAGGVGPQAAARQGRPALSDAHE